MLLVQDVSPEQTRERSAESSAESAVVDADGHAVDGGPECSVTDRDAVVGVDLLPGLDDAGEEDGGADVCACELLGVLVGALPLMFLVKMTTRIQYLRCTRSPK
jgi:hypothetical protein